MHIKKKLYLLLVVFLSITKVNAQSEETAITIQAVAGLQFDIARFNVKPGSKVKITLVNMDDMSHNFLITKPGARLDIVNEALKLEEKGPQMNYIPKSSKVLWSIPVLSPNQSQSITFTAPGETGAYPYVCTYPGHGFVMYGVMYVSNDGKMPAMKADPNIPPSRQDDKDPEAPVKNETHGAHHPEKPAAHHPYELVPPYLYRIFMEDASPASIAVRLPGDLNYCWDAGSCKLRYAWAGGFVDNAVLWKGHKDANAKILGTVFYRDQSIYPLRIGKSESIPTVDYKGYKLVNRYPEFHYTVNGIDVYELILPKEDGTGLIRKFKIPEAGRPVWFVSNKEEGSHEFTASTGKWENGMLKLTAQQAREFTITMTNYSLVYSRKK
ncbi:MAG TPA: plastocyanin/azurin family copper-binding protein [Sphingobacteriaceae bacterium]